MKKIKVVFHTEYTNFNSGFAILNRNFMQRLHQKEGLEIAEFAMYAERGNPQFDTPWRLFPIMPSKQNKNEYDFHFSNPSFQFGALAFERMCLKFQPDVVFSCLDPWCFDYMIFSPYRPFYKLIIMPMVDAIPQLGDWISNYINADLFLGANGWITDTINRIGGNLIKNGGTVPLGSNSRLFNPVCSKRSHKKNLGFDPDAFIIGTVMRNQKRKLFQNLFRAYSVYLNGLDANSRNKTFLYCHTSYPDVGWELADLMLEYGISNRVIYTYICNNCGVSYHSLFQGARSFCKHCRQPSLTFPNTIRGVTPENMPQIFNLFDLYVQYATNEGIGLGILEAASCGVPVCAPKYTSPEYMIPLLNGYLIDIQQFNVELESGRYMAIPSESHLVDIINEFRLTPEPMRAKRGYEAREACIKHFNYDDGANILYNYFVELGENLDPARWFSPISVIQHPKEIPNNLPPSDFVKWCVFTILNRPDLLYHHYFLRMIQNLTNGFVTMPENSHANAKHQQVGLQETVNEIWRMREKMNYWETQRQAIINKTDE